MGILSVFASLFGTSCSKNTVHVEFINAQDNSVIGVSDMLPDQLPESFAINTSLDLKNNKWSVQSADPLEKSKFIQTRKLRVVLSPITLVSPQDVLFSLATISDDGGAVAGNSLPSDKIFAIHEDDWRQVEFISDTFSNEISEELADIAKIYQTQSDGVGFKKLHVRKRIPKPLAGRSIKPADLEAAFLPASKFDSVGFQRTQGTIPNSFAWKLDDGLVLWGVTDINDEITRLCIYGSPKTGNTAKICETFAMFSQQHKLTMVDWCKATNIIADTGAYSGYFRQQ